MRQLGATISAAVLASIDQAHTPYIPSRPSLLRLQQSGRRVVDGKGRVYTRIDERLYDNTRYPGHVLREIRKSGQARECARRLARMKKAA